MKVKLFVGNLPPETSSREIRSLFEQYGKVLDCDILKNYGFVHIEGERAAEKAVRKLHHYNLHGSSINVEPSTNPNPTYTKLHVSNLSRKCTELELRAKFEVYGRVMECDILRHFGFVHMERAEDALEAIQGLHRTKFRGKRMLVQLSTSRLRTGPGMGDSSTCYRCGKSGHWFRECPGVDPGRAAASSNQHARQYPALRMPFARASEAPVLPRGQNEALQYRQPYPVRPAKAAPAANSTTKAVTGTTSVASMASANRYNYPMQIPAQLPQVQNPAAASALTYSSLGPSMAHLWPTSAAARASTTVVAAASAPKAAAASAPKAAAASAPKAAAASAPRAATASNFVRHLRPLSRFAAAPTLRDGPDYEINNEPARIWAATLQALYTVARSMPERKTSQGPDANF